MAPPSKSASFASRSLSTAPPWLPCPYSAERQVGDELPAFGAEAERFDRRFDIGLQFAKAVVPFARAKPKGPRPVDVRKRADAAGFEREAFVLSGGTDRAEADFSHLHVAEVAEKMHRPVKVVGLDPFDVIRR